MDRQELEHKTVVELREIAEKYDDIVGASGMKKEDLVVLLAAKLGIDLHEHVPKGIGRAKLKAGIRTLKSRRDAALAAKDGGAFRKLRRQIKHHRRELRKTIAHALKEEKRRKEAAS